MSVDEGKSGVIRDVVRAAADEHRDVTRAARGEQLELMPAPSRFTDRRGDALQLALRHHHGPGRPAGAQNLGTKEFREYLLAQGVSPLSQIMRWSLHTPTSLAAELKCTRLEAFRLLKELWAELAPYLHQRMPLAVEVDQRSAGVLILGHISADQARKIGDQFGVADLRVIEQETQQTQALSAHDAAVSHEPVSHETAKDRET